MKRKKKQKKPNNYPHSFANRLRRRLSWSLFIILAISTYIIHDAMFGIVEDNQAVLFQAEAGVTNERVRRIISDVYVGVSNHVTEVEASLDHPDRLGAVMEHVVRRNAHIHSCGISFIADYYPKKGHAFSPYAVRKDSMEVLVSNKVGVGDDNYLQADWFAEASHAKEPYWSRPYYEDNDTLNSYVAYIAPIHNHQGETVAVLRAALPLDWLKEEMAEEDQRIYKETISMGDSERNKGIFANHTFLIDSTGTYLVHPNKQYILHHNFFDEVKQSPDTLLQYLAGRIARRESMNYSGADIDYIDPVNLDGRHVYLHFLPVKHTSWTLIMTIPRAFFIFERIVLAIVLAFLIFISLLVIQLVTRFFIRRSVKPLVTLAGTADEVAKGHFDTPLPRIKSRDELQMLRDSFENMQHSLTGYIQELQSTTAQKATIESELKIAHGIQMELIPKTFPPYPERHDIDIYGSLTPAKDVGGDLFDFHIRDEQLFFCIGDVSGKGVPASLVMAVTRTLFRTISNHESQPHLILRSLNNTMAEKNDNMMFVTLFIGVLDLRTGHLRYSNAGHDAPLMIGSGTVASLPCDANLPVGVIHDWAYTMQETYMSADTTIFLYTDGLTEAENAVHGQFGMERIMPIVEEALSTAHNQPTPLIDSMTAAVHQFVADAEQSDDLTMLAVQWKKTI